MAAGAAGGVLIAGSNAATTFATLTSTGAFTINGTSTVAQTGDSFARIGSAGAGLTALGDTRIANLDATVSSRLAPTVASRTLDVTATGGAGIDWANVENQGTTVTLSATTINAVTTISAPTAAQIATAVWQDTTAGDFTTSGSIGQSLFTGVAPGGSGGFVKIGTNTGNLTLSGIVTASNASNVITLGSAQDVASAVAWGASVIGNSRTRDYFLQGGLNKFESGVPAPGQATLYQTDDSSVLKVFSTSSSPVDPIVSIDPA